MVGKTALERANGRQGARNNVALFETNERLPRRRVEPPETALLYSVADIARMARVGKASVIRLCLNGLMPEWLEIGGHKYWARANAVEAVAQASRRVPRQNAA